MKAKIFALLISFSSLANTAESYSIEEKQPLLSMSKCLASFNWSSWNIWRFDIYASPLDQVLIGDIDNYFKFSKFENGYQHIIDGKIVAEYADIISIKDIAPTCDANCPVNYKKRIGWFKRQCKMFID